MSKTESAKAALERIRIAMNNRTPANSQDVDTLISFFMQLEGMVDDAVELLYRLQTERVRKILEDLQ